MFSGLRLRLFASYLLLLAVAIGVLAASLIVILNTRAAPAQPTYERLATIALSVDLRRLLFESRPGLLATLQERLDALSAQLVETAADVDVRILLVNLQDLTVYFDSAQTLAFGEKLDGRVDSDRVPTSVRRGYITNVDALIGQFVNPDGAEWLFVGVQAFQQRGETTALVFAEPRPTQTLQQALSNFGAEILPVVCQSAVAGVVIALVLAGVISRGIAQPLRTVAMAAQKVAEGSYSERVPISGPDEVRAVALAFNQMATAVEAAQQSQQDFLANVSHDLKTPLTSIQGYSQAIIDGAAQDSVGAAKIIHEEAGRLNRMVVELTDLARLQSGRLSMRSTPIDLGQLTEAVGQRLAIVAREKGVALHIAASSMPPIAGDGDRLAQVLTNLISNAINYTPAGGSVRVQTQLRNGGVEVLVQDTGIGIPAGELPRIFERFYQVDKARGPRRGTGLGLAIVHEIVQAHGGTITAASEGEGRGSTFTVWLPSPHLSTVLRRR